MDWVQRTWARSDAGSGRPAPGSTCGGANRTRPGVRGRPAQARAMPLPAVAALRARSESSRPVFFSRHQPLVGQPDLRQHGERDVAIPTVPRAHLIAVEPDLALGFLDDLLHRVARARHLRQLLERDRFGGAARNNTSARSDHSPTDERATRLPGQGSHRGSRSRARAPTRRSVAPSCQCRRSGASTARGQARRSLRPPSAPWAAPWASRTARRGRPPVTSCGPSREVAPASSASQWSAPAHTNTRAPESLRAARASHHKRY